MDAEVLLIQVAKSTWASSFFFAFSCHGESQYRGSNTVLFLWAQLTMNPLRVDWTNAEQLFWNRELKSFLSWGSSALDSEFVETGCWKNTFCCVQNECRDEKVMPHALRVCWPSAPCLEARSATRSCYCMQIFSSSLPLEPFYPHPAAKNVSANSK